MDQQENQDVEAKEGRRRRDTPIKFTAELLANQLSTINDLCNKKMKQTGQDVTRDDILKEAVEQLAKAWSGRE